MLSKMIPPLLVAGGFLPLPALAADDHLAARYDNRLGLSDAGTYTVPYVFDINDQVSWARAPWPMLSATAKDPCLYISHHMSFVTPNKDQLSLLLVPKDDVLQFPGGLHGDFYTTTRQGDQVYVINFDSQEGRFISLPDHGYWGAGVQVLCFMPGAGADL